VKCILVALLIATITACSSQNANPSLGLPSAMRHGVKSTATVIVHHTTITNVYVATQCKYGSPSCEGAEAILRFTAGEDTSTPNKTKTLTYNPNQMAVSQYNGRVAVIHCCEDNLVTVYDKDLGKLYDVTPHKNVSSEFPIAVTYDNSGNLYISQFDPYSGNGRVLEYYGNDTTTDKTWSFTHGGYNVDVITMDAGTNLWVAEYGVASYMDDILDCHNVSSTLCVDTGIHNDSHGNVTFDVFPEDIALLNEGSVPGSELTEMYCSDSYVFNCEDNDSYIQYYTDNASGTWQLTSTLHVCDGSSDLYMNYLASDSNHTLYWSCFKWGPSYAGNSVVEEKLTSGTKYTISGLTYPVAVGAY
jgi:hypothetical protein